MSEILALRVSDVDFAHHTIRLRHTKSGEPQTRGFHPSADDALKRWIDTRRKLKIAANGHPLFCKLDGGPMSANYVNHMVKRLADKAGVDKRVHPHGFRHTFAAELAWAGIPVPVITKLLGHKSVATTNAYLAALTSGDAISALTVIDLPEVDVPPEAEDNGAERLARLEAQVGQLMTERGPGQAEITAEITAYLRGRGIRLTGEESADELCEAYLNLRKGEDDGAEL